MKKIGITVNRLYLSAPDTVNFEALARDGFACADGQYFVNTETALFAMSPKEYEAHLARERAHAADAGVALYQVHGPWRWPVNDGTPEARAERMEKMQRSLYGSAVLGAKVMVIHPIMPFGTDADPDPAALWQMNLEYYGKLAETAKETGVQIALENMPFPALSDASAPATLRMVRELNSPWVGFCLDTGHCIILGDEPAEVLPSSLDRLLALHIHDNDGQHDQHKLPGQGIIRWDAFRQALAQVPDGIPVNFECGSDLSAEGMLRTMG